LSGESSGQPGTERLALLTDILGRRILPSTMVLVMCALEVVEWASKAN
jgi:hypothetical protein